MLASPFKYPAVAVLLRYLGENQPFALAQAPRLRCYALSDAWTRRELGWAPRISWPNGLRSSAKWWQGNLGFWNEALDRPEVAAFFRAQYGGSVVVPASV